MDNRPTSGLQFLFKEYIIQNASKYSLEQILETVPIIYIYWYNGFIFEGHTDLI